MTEFDAAEFGRAMGQMVREAMEPLKAQNAELAKRIEELEAALAEVPEPPKLSDLIAHEGLKTLIDLQVNEYMAENPPKAGEKGADGCGVADLLIDREGSLVVTMTDGRMKSLGNVVGTNGRDGIAFDKCVGEFDPERGYVLKFSNGETAVEHVLPYMRHGGFWSEGKSAGAGESMTHDGALWIAKRATKAKPCLENAEDWILAARKGRDGRDGRNGVDKTAPAKVKSDA